MSTLDVVVPVYNEPPEVVSNTIAVLREALATIPDSRIILVDDGSAPEFRTEELRKLEGVTFVQHEKNRGYGSALKTGILTGTGDWIAIIDADGTYPVEELPRLVERMPGHDMVIGIRTGEIREIPLLRRFPKMVLNMLASYMAGETIRDLNSGMRVFRRELSYYLWDFFPRGFSFTSTITMGAIMGGFRLYEQPINYYKREGKSSIHPIRDTVRFFRLVCRLGLIFYPMKIFGPVAAILGCAGFFKAFFIDYANDGHIGNLAAATMVAAIQVVMMGLIGKLIVHGRFLHSPTAFREGRQVAPPAYVGLRSVPEEQGVQKRRSLSSI
ncbi:MAG: glycosyltransferase family 2 protein [Bdellovibrionales bacterium]|nr:glycosyltransferase family 2 protein [Bdellovibrionales bacterium]